MRPIDADDLKEHIVQLMLVYSGTELENAILNAIDNAETVEEKEESFITECRDKAIEDNLPLYFIYYEETGVLEVYVTKTKELFEKVRWVQPLSYYELERVADIYLNAYSKYEGDV